MGGRLSQGATGAMQDCHDEEDKDEDEGRGEPRSKRDAETGEQLFVDTHDGGFRKRFAQAAERRETALRAALAEAGIDCLELATDDQLGAALLRFTELRKMRSRLAGGGVHRPMAG